MTDSLINTISREYVMEITKDMAKNLDEPSCLLNETISMNTEYVGDFLKWLSERFVIVEKRKASELCRLTLEHGNSVDYGLIDGLTDIVCDIFREQYHEEAEK